MGKRGRKKHQRKKRQFMKMFWKLFNKKKGRPTLSDDLSEAFKNYKILPVPELWPELNPANWSEEYKAFREKYPDDHHKRIFRSSERYSINQTDNNQNQNG